MEGIYNSSEMVSRDAFGLTSVFAIGREIMVFPAGKSPCMFDENIRFAIIDSIGPTGIIALFEGGGLEHVSPNWITLVDKETKERLLRGNAYI
jgi:hypothetical protein